ncbi:Lactose transport system permease protein LacF [Oceanobacillus oncorhynchi]|uniref:Lactose transport system permease protein LacF n=1 Tax=Oceanobacillus oncorhynchi TaxID=545501 RepID=A0A0A1MN71_9BACI|nr:sugar ABC transporter permease [Oceanobacillus oncorhynchi]CEI80546.1 Lactose transport system permease protein LacF [Oceanobacillus oncorhynchi]
MNIKKKENLAAYIFLAPALILLGLFLVYPSLLAIYYSFTDYYLLTPNDINIVWLENFIAIFKDPVFIQSLKNIALFVVLVIPIQVGAALGLALLINKQRKGNIFFKVAFFSPVVLSLVVISVLWLYLLNPSEGLINNILLNVGIDPQPFLSSPTQAMVTIVFVSAWQGAGYQMLIFLAGLQNIPGEVYEAGKIDGVNKWQKFYYITLPLLKPTSILIMITTLISAFKLIIQPMVMTQGGPMNATMTPVYYIYQSGFSDRMIGYASAMTVIFGIVIGIVTLIQSRVSREDDN